MTDKQVLARLRSLGSAQTRKTYGRHGVTGKMYGVKYGDLYKLVKQIKVDHGLTSCQTPLATPYIRKAAAHHRARLAKANKKRTK